MILFLAGVGVGAVAVGLLVLAGRLEDGGVTTRRDEPDDDDWF